MRGFRGRRMRLQKLLLKELWRMTRTPGVVTMSIIMAKVMSVGIAMGKAIIMDILVMKAVTAIMGKVMSAAIIMVKVSTVAIRRETKDAVAITANKKRLFVNPVYLYFHSRDCSTWFKNTISIILKQ